MNSRSSQKRYSVHSGEDNQSKKVKEDDGSEQSISPFHSSNSYQANQLMSAENNFMSSSSDWNAFGEQSSSNARQDHESSVVSSSTSSSSSNSKGLLLSGTSVSGPISQLLSSETPKKKPMNRDERIADLETKISNKEAELPDLAKEINQLKEERRQIMRLKEEKQSKELLKILSEDIYEKKNEKERLLAEIAQHKGELDNLRKAATTPKASISGNYLFIYHM